MNARITRITVSVAELEKSLPFYRDAIGLDLLYSLDGMVMLRAGDGVEVQLHERPPTPGDASVAVSFGVADVDTATAASVAAGASVLKPPADQPWGERQSVLHDPDGHVVCLVAPLGAS